jgi:hypothetical protein
MMVASDRPGDIATAHTVSSCDDSRLCRPIAAPWYGLTHRPGARPGTLCRMEEGQPHMRRTPGGTHGGAYRRMEARPHMRRTPGGTHGGAYAVVVVGSICSP